MYFSGKLMKTTEDLGSNKTNVQRGCEGRFYYHVHYIKLKSIINRSVGGDGLAWGSVTPVAL